MCIFIKHVKYVHRGHSKKRLGSRNASLPAIKEPESLNANLRSVSKHHLTKCTMESIIYFYYQFLRWFSFTYCLLELFPKLLLKQAQIENCLNMWNNSQRVLRVTENINHIIEEKNASNHELYNLQKNINYFLFSILEGHKIIKTTVPLIPYFRILSNQISLNILMTSKQLISPHSLRSGF